ncbi:MAG TPA: GntR family transcriptional regulator [Candidatus Angelobacter sp.]|nr:GntR family transcriptional regulator [Candidatus Angelobacter sp.]
MSTNFSLEKAEPYYEQIYQTIKKLIFEGAYKPGERIFEAKIAKEFNVSRSPVREAVRAIEKEGLLVLNDKQQLEVYKPSLQDVKEIYSCRGGLESLAVKLATERATDQNIEELKSILDHTLDAVKKTTINKEEVVICNTRFHDTILMLSGNKRLQKMLKELSALNYIYRVLNIDTVERMYTIYEEHLGIFIAMKERDITKAVKQMYGHITHDLEHLIGVLEERG